MDTKLNLELAKEYYNLAIKSSLVFYLLLGLVTYFYWGHISTSILLAWTGINTFTATLFLVAAYLFKRYGTESNAAQWLQTYTYLVYLHDIPWGLIGPLSYLIDIQAYQMLSLFLLGGITAGGIITRASLFKNYFISLISLLLPISIVLALDNSDQSLVMLGMVLIYTAFMLSGAKDYSKTINRNIQLWLDNEKLVEELRQSSADVEAAKERAIEASNAKSQFLATISHELRTPLNGIMGFTELLQNEPMELKYKHSVDQIEKAGKSLLNIVSDILDIAAIEQGRIRFHEESFSLRTELKDIIALLQPMANKKGLALSLNVDSNVEDILRGDVTRLRQIVSNLLSNGIKYTEQGEVKLQINQQNSLDNNSVLRFDIIDTGIGIQKNELKIIFENFTRLEGFETRCNEGTGLGLAIVKNLVEKLGGELFVRSEIGQGSCFSFILKFEPGNTNEAKDNHNSNHSHTVAQLPDLKVLVVDDNGINRKLLSAFLTKMGATFNEASNGREALEQMRSEQYDVVLLDIQMPDITGLEVAATVLEEFAIPPLLIAITAHAFPEQRKTILDAGFKDFLIKPVTMKLLSNMLTEAYYDRQTKNVKLS